MWELSDQVYFIPLPRCAHTASETWEWIKVPTPVRKKMLLGTFKTVFNSVFLVPPKTNTPHHMAKMGRCNIPKRGGEMGRERWRGGGHLSTSSAKTHNLGSFPQYLTWICLVFDRGQERQCGFVGPWSISPTFHPASILISSLQKLGSIGMCFSWKEHAKIQKKMKRMNPLMCCHLCVRSPVKLRSKLY